MITNNDNGTPEWDVDAQLTAYALGELEGDDKIALEARLESEPALRDQLESIRGVTAQLESVFATEPTHALTSAQRDAIEQGEHAAPIIEVKPNPWRLNRWLGVGVTAAAACVTFILFMPNFLSGEREASDVAIMTDDVADSAMAPGSDRDSMVGLQMSADLESYSNIVPGAAGEGVTSDQFVGVATTDVSDSGDVDVTGVNALEIDIDGALSEQGRTSPSVFTSTPPPSPPSGRAAGQRGGGSGGSHNNFMTAYTDEASDVRGSSGLASSDMRDLSNERQKVVIDDETREKLLESQRRREAQLGAAVQKFGQETYGDVVHNPFKRPIGDDMLSTVSVDVDRASYSLGTQMIMQQNRIPPAGAVRIEEWINSFTYNDAPPAEDAETPFSCTMEVNQAPWATNHRLVRIGLKGYEVAADDRPATNLVFLIDVSGSMNQPNKLPLLQRSLKALVNELTPDDRVAMVTYAGNAGVAMESTFCTRRDQIIRSIDRLTAGGGTNGAGGIQLAYEQAQKHFIEGGINRVILATDGDFNVGISETEALEKFIAEKRESGVYLSVLGFGTGNYKDDKMERLSNVGNGNYAYINSLDEAHEVLVRRLSGTLMTIAKDVKVQIDFNPKFVQAYRQIGYENRVMANADFRNDRKDAGDIGAGHAVTFLYEVVPPGVDIGGLPEFEATDAEPSEFIAEAEAENIVDSDRMLVVRLRYKQPDGDESVERRFPLVDDGRMLDDASADFTFASAVAAFGMVLRESPYKGNSSMSLAKSLATTGADRFGQLQRDVENYLDYVNASKHAIANEIAQSLLAEDCSPAEFASVIAMTETIDFDTFTRTVDQATANEETAPLATMVRDRVELGLGELGRGLPGLDFQPIKERAAFVRLIERAESLQR
ncbi:MAG: von Willebrand factor type A domain-containing protein [Planctomycetota bacterium]